MSNLSLSLNNPFGGESAFFNVITSVPDESNEIIQTIKFLSEDFSELDEILENYFKIPKRFEKFYESLKSLCESFNDWTKQKETYIRTKNLEVDPLKLRASSKLAKFILHLIYNRAVLDPDKLNHYEPFSPQVYGETSFDLIEKMLKRVKLKENDTFIDLGSGVGNVVLQVAAVSRCKRCFGFEKAEWPAFYAVKMEKEFKYWMHFFGRTYSEFQLYKGDFLSEEEYLEVNNDSDPSKIRKVTTGSYVKELIDQANLIFVNNFAFGAEVDHQLKLRFLDMLEGAFIVSSKPFCPLNFRINDRNLNDFGAILNLDAYEPLNGHVSWTDKPIYYYFQKIDRTLLEKYYESKFKPQLKNKDDKDANDRPSRSKNPHSPHSPISSNSSASDSSKSDSPQSPANSTHSKHSKTRNRSNSKENKKRKSEIDKKQHLNKKSKLSKEFKKERNRSKSLDKDEKKTLEKMHLQVSKVTKSEVKEDKLSTSNMKLNNLAKETSKDTPLKDNFNQKTMTKLTSENLDNKSLKDTKISSKFTKHLNAIKNAKIPNGPTKLDDCHLKNAKRIDLDEEKARNELGDDIMNSIDNYFKKCREQFINYLLYMKSSEYKEKLNTQYKKEMSLKTELMKKKEELENQKKSILKNNISLLKQRAAELGVNELKSPSELIQCAKEILAQHKLLEEKMNSILDTLSNRKSPIPTSQENIILKKIVENFEKDENVAKIVENEKSGAIQINELKSVASTNSTDETLTATERADDDDEEEFNKETKIETENTQKQTLKQSRPNSNPTAPTPPPATKTLMDKIFQNNDRIDSLKSFKIPKQSRKEPMHSNSEDRQVSPRPFSNSSSNSNCNPRSPTSAFETNIHRNKHNRNLSNDFNLEFSSSSSSSPSNTQTESKSYTNYYHPKKKYMMENSNNKRDFKEDNYIQDWSNGVKSKQESEHRNPNSFSTQSSSSSSYSISNDSNTQYNQATTSYSFYNSK